MAFGIRPRDENHDEYGDLAEINIIPLVDIMLVLLIIFMVAAPLSITGIKVSLPTSKAKGTSITPKRIVLSIDQHGDYFMDQGKIAGDQLEEKLRAIFSVQDQKEIYIRADRKVVYEKVVDAMSAAKLAGVTKMSMLTSPANGKTKTL